MGNIPRSFTAGQFFLNLDGAKIGYLKSVDGGTIKADVVAEPSEGAAAPKKHLGAVRAEEFELEVDFAMGKSLWTWLAGSWVGKPTRRSGSIVETDLNLQARTERRFSDALVTATTIPALDAAAKAAVFLTVRFLPESVESRKGDGSKLAPPRKPAQKSFLPSNFSLELAGLDCSRVSKIDSFTVTQKLSTDDVGERREREREPGSVEIPNLRVTLAESAAQTWVSWFDDFVVNGKNDDGQEKAGAIVFLTPDRKDELGRVTLGNVGIFSLSPAPAPAGGDTVRRLLADLYVERMSLRIGPPR